MTQELEPRNPTPLATTNIKRGLEEPSSQEDITIPRAQLLQSNSPKIVDDREKKYSIGTIINSLTGKELGREFVPIFKYTNWVRWNPRDNRDPNFDLAYDPGAMIWRSNDPTDPRVIEQSKFGENGERPAATKFLNFFSYFPGETMPIVVSFCNTSFRAGKKLNSLCQFSPGSAIFERKYILLSRQVENDKGKFYVLDVEMGGPAEEEVYKIAEKWFTQFHPRISELKVDEEDNAQ